MAGDSKEFKSRLLKLIDDIADQDKALRQELGIGDKFRFVRDRIDALQAHLHETMQSIKDDVEEKKAGPSEEEQLVYVYLFNAHGIDLQTWHKMLRPSVFYEYSVNRPIYKEKADIEAFIRSKQERVQHGYMTIAVKKDCIHSHGETYKDNIGHPLLKVKEGSLRPEGVMHFAHNGILYLVGENGNLQKMD